MKYAVVFSLFALYLLALAILVGGWAWLLLWPTLSFGLVGAGYAGLGPRVFGKRPDGRLAAWAVLILLPYLLLTWGLWHLWRYLSREPACHEVIPGLWLGRRPLPHELPPGTDLVVDLTAEFRAAPGLKAGRTYVCLPTLDALVPSENELRALVERVAAWPGVAYVHCAAGHGRSALVAAAVLLARGRAGDVREAIRALREARPRARVKGAQRRLLDRLACPAKPAREPRAATMEARP
jgi:protein-tyrosine phosphatase